VSRGAFGLLKELRRRRVFRVAGLYVVGVWLLMQAADVLFPGWGIPDAAIRYLFWAGLLGFPLALAFGWVFDISAEVDFIAQLDGAIALKQAEASRP
jgi:hypothetical protein